MQQYILPVDQVEPASTILYTRKQEQEETGKEQEKKQEKTAVTIVV